MPKKPTKPPHPAPTLRDRAEEGVRVSATDSARMSPGEAERMVHELQVHQIELEMQNEELRRAQVELAQSRDRYSLLYDFAPVGYVTLDENGTVLEANLTLATMLGVERGKLVGSKFTRFVAPAAQDTLYLHQRTVLDSDVKQACDLDLRRADGTPFTVRLETSGLHNAVTGVCHQLSTLRDITLRKLAEEQLQQQADELATRARLLTKQNAEIEQARLALVEKVAELTLTSRYKSEFLANMSHELRTPLNPILIFSQQLAQNKAGNLTGKQVEFSQHIHSSGTDLLHLISDILDLSKIESGTVTVTVQEIPFAELHDSIDRNFRHVAEAKNLPFTVNFAPDLPKAMDSDPKRLQQILKNLLSNAVKFTAHGSVEVRVDLATHGWSHDHPVLSKAPQVIGFSVEDTGIGIAPDKQQLIFESFQQADASTARNYGGTGLGLAISRDLTALLGGEIRLASTWGAGSTFTLYLPLHYAGAGSTQVAPAKLPPFAPAEHLDALEKTRETAHPASNGDLRGSRVLVVDDDPRNIFAMLSLLEDQEMEVFSATDGRQAVEIIHSTPDLSLVLMDIMMPGMDGYATLREIRQSPECHTLPIIAVTAKAMPGDREKCLQAGASDCIAKPVNTTQLLALMRRWILR